MNSNTKKILIVSGVAAAGAAFWYFFFGPGATAATATASTTTAATSGTSAWTNPANAAEVQTLVGWVSQNSAANQAVWAEYAPNITQSELDNMNALITQFWSVGAQPTTALNNWWVSFKAAHGLS